MPTTNKYAAQRPKVTPPHVPLGELRVALGMTIDQLLDRIEEETGHRYTRGALSAVENGHRGASTDMIQAITVALGLRPGSVTTNYEPRRGAAA